MELNAHDVLVKNAHVWNLLRRHGVRCVKVLDELGRAEDVLEVVRAC